MKFSYYIYNREVYSAAENCLKEIKNELESFFENINYEEEVQIIEILIQLSISKNSQIKLTTFEWLNMFLNKYKLLFIQSSKLKSPYSKAISFMTLQSNKNPEYNYNNSKYYQNFNFTNTSQPGIMNIFSNNNLNVNNNNINTAFKTPLSLSNTQGQINNSSLMNSNFFSFNNNMQNQGNSGNNSNNGKIQNSNLNKSHEMVTPNLKSVHFNVNSNVNSNVNNLINTNNSINSNLLSFISLKLISIVKLFSNGLYCL